MRSGWACLLGLAGVALTNALSLEKRDNPAVLAVPMVRDTSRQLSRRSGTIGVGLNNERVYYISYVANVTFGTPPQNFLAYFDTWGNGCWLEGVDDSDCYLFGDRSSCGGYGGYNFTASTTAKMLDERFSYNDSGTITSGDYVTDVFRIGNVTVDTMKMGIVEDDEITANTFGLGYGDASSTSLTQALADAGAINSPAFSLWRQTALFGGVNRAKYTGPLYTFPIVNGSDLVKAFRINMTDISINETSAVTNDFPLDAVFDTVFDMTYVPKSVAQALNAQIGTASAPDRWGQVNLSCSAVGENSTIEFKFGELEFQFYLSDFITQESETAAKYGWSPDEDTCYFTICENIHYQNEGSIILGSNFISKTYAVFDLENDEVSLALPNWRNAPDDIVEITSGKNGVPGTTSGVTSTTSGVSSTTSGASETTKHSAATRIEAGLGMGALMFSAALHILVFWI
ncbi:hypothetical protein N7507_001324 [Penicillium longicatenatum]|nr:hypothetical protein N7507_001324 [Penicillium longicatenatum]